MLEFEVFTEWNYDRDSRKALREIVDLDDLLRLHGYRDPDDYLADLVTCDLGFRVLNKREPVLVTRFPNCVKFARIIDGERHPLPPPGHSSLAELINNEEGVQTNFLLYCVAYWELFLLPGVHVLPGESGSFVVTVDETGRVLIALLGVEGLPTGGEPFAAGWHEGVTPEFILAEEERRSATGTEWLHSVQEIRGHARLSVEDWLRGILSIADQYVDFLNRFEAELFAEGYPPDPDASFVTLFDVRLSEVADEIQTRMSFDVGDDVTVTKRSPG